MFCNICGCPIFPPLDQRPAEGGVVRRSEQQAEEDKQLKWMGQAVMLSDPAEEFETLELHYHAGKKPGVPELQFTRDDQEIQRDEATMAGRDEVVLVKDGIRMRPNWGVGLDEGGQRHPGSTPYGIVVHAACLDVFERVMRNKSRRRHRLRVPSLRTLWKVLRMRLDACDNDLLGRPTHPDQYAPLWRRNFYYLYLTPTPFTTNWRILWRDFHGEWLLEDPTTIPDLTNILLSNVRRVEIEAVNQETQAFHKAFMSLPLELRDHILELLSSCDDLHLFWTGLLPQEVWRDMLLGKKSLPFLYDIDDAAVLRFTQEKEGKASDTNNFDWESLVRSLSRGAWASRNFYEPPDYEHEWDVSLPKRTFYYCDLLAPAGLRNRRRIWQLVEEMFVGDVLPWKDSGTSVPRYWDEYGERVYPVVRLSDR